jgi:hypothetical protein
MQMDANTLMNVGAGGMPNLSEIMKNPMFSSMMTTVNASPDDGKPTIHGYDCEQQPNGEPNDGI